MFAAINKAVTLVVSFGPGQTGKTVGYTIKNGDGTTFQARTTTGVSELQASSGIYKVEVANSVFTAAFDGYVIWDVANAAPYACEDIVISDRLDVAVSSRSTYAGADTAGTTTLLARLTSTRAGNLDNLDAAISGVAAAVWAVATRTLTAASDSAGITTLLARLTSGRATNLDNLDAAVSTRSTYAGADTPGTTTLLSRLTSTRAGNLDFLDESIVGAATAILNAIPSAAAIAAAVWGSATRTLSSVTAIVNGVWNELLAGHTTAGSAGAQLTAAGASGDPWLTEVPGVYTGEEAGAVFGAIKAKTDLISGSTIITLVAPVLASGKVKLVQGDDYKNGDGRALQWSSTSWPVLTGGSVSLDLRNSSGDTFAKAGTVVSASAVRVDLTAAETAALDATMWRYAVKATLSDGDLVTLAVGELSVAVRP